MSRSTSRIELDRIQFFETSIRFDSINSKVVRSEIWNYENGLSRVYMSSVRMILLLTFPMRSWFPSTEKF